MSETFIDYDAKVQEALRGVVRKILQETAEEGLKGEHHFYVAFKTQAEGVNIPASLVSRFPDEMTIVLQHKFWGLAVHEDRFEIGLSFNQKPEHLEIPFSAVVGFVDPSVQFALQFHDENGAGDDMTGQDDVASDEDGMFLEESDDIAEDIGSNKAENEDANGADERDNVVTLDAFRKK